MVEKQIKWAGHVERMAEDHLTKRADAHRDEGRRRRGLRAKIHQECRNRRKLEGKSTRQKRMETSSSEGDWETVATPSPLTKGCTRKEKNV